MQIEHYLHSPMKYVYFNVSHRLFFFLIINFFFCNNNALNDQTTLSLYGGW